MLAEVSTAILAQSVKADSDEISELVEPTSRAGLAGLAPDSIENSVSDTTSASAETPASLTSPSQESSTPDAARGKDSTRSIDSPVVGKFAAGFIGCRRARAYNICQLGIT